MQIILQNKWGETLKKHDGMAKKNASTDDTQKNPRQKKHTIKTWGTRTRQIKHEGHAQKARGIHQME